MVNYRRLGLKSSWTFFSLCQLTSNPGISPALSLDLVRTYSGKCVRFRESVLLKNLSMTSESDLYRSSIPTRRSFTLVTLNSSLKGIVGVREKEREEERKKEKKEEEK